MDREKKKTILIWLAAIFLPAIIFSIEAIFYINGFGKALSFYLDALPADNPILNLITLALFHCSLSIILIIFTPAKTWKKLLTTSLIVIIYTPILVLFIIALGCATGNGCL